MAITYQSLAVRPDVPRHLYPLPSGRATTSTEQPPFNEGSYAAGITTVGEFREVATFLVAEGTGNRISVHVFMDRDGGGEGDAFLADAISIAEGPGGGTSGGGC